MRTVVKVAGSIAVSLSANRHSRELPANASMASAVRVRILVFESKRETVDGPGGL
jgi:hypothetical protein